MVMSATTETTERRLLEDLAGEDFNDDKFCRELYRALANNVWSPDDGDGEVALSWKRAEELINRLRADQGAEPLALERTGGEGRISDLVADRLHDHGWTARPLDTSTEEEAHLGRPEHAPPRKAGETQSDDPTPSTLDPAARRSGSFQAGRQAERERPNSRNHR